MIDDLHRGLARRIWFWRRQARLMAAALDHLNREAERAALLVRAKEIQDDLAETAQEIELLVQRVNSLNAK